MGPNEGKTYLEQVRCVARTLMTISPRELGDPIEQDRIYTEYALKHGGATNKWLKYVCPWGTWYVYDGDPLGAGGRSSAELPEGEEVAATLDLRSTEDGFLRRFEKSISQIESGIEPSNQGGQSNSEKLETGDTIRGYATHFRRVLWACRPDYNEQKINEFRNWLRKQPGVELHPSDPNLIRANPEYLVAFSRRLASDRANFLADARLFGSVAAIADICIYSGSKAQTHKVRGIKLSPSQVFGILAHPLTSYSKTDPVDILDDTVQVAMNEGFVDELLDVVKNYRQKVADKIEEALDSPNTDECLDKLYEAAPYSFATRIILPALLRNPVLLGENLSFVKGSYNEADETFVKILIATRTQVTDFFGARWMRHKNNVEQIKRERGRESAKKYVDYLIEGNYFYPRRYKTELMRSPRKTPKSN